MSLAEDLLQQAAHLAALDTNRPKQANLRRAVSAAYYAMFHYLGDEVVRLLVPATPAGLGNQSRRALAHASMRRVCDAVASGALSPSMKKLMPVGFGLNIRQVAKAFVDLQEARHIADYDLEAVQDRASVLLYIEQARDAIAAWRPLRATDEARVFLTALLLADKWSR